MKTQTATYWTTTSLVAAAFAFGGVADLLRLPPVMETLSALGYPAYIATILGVWKLLAVAALLAPKFPRLKEWAYAGMFFDLSGAVASHLFAGDPPSSVLAPAVLLLLVMFSWALRPAARTFGAPLTRMGSTAAPSPARSPASTTA